MPLGLSWKFSPNYLLNNTPSRIDEISFKEELEQRKFCVDLITQAGISLLLSSEVIGTASVYLHRYYSTQSFKNSDKFITCAGCLFLATKLISDGNRKLGDVITVFHHISTNSLLPIGEEYWQRKDDLIAAELDILCALHFDLDFKLPYSWLLTYLKSLQGSNQLAQTAWNICNDSFKTLLCVKYDSSAIAVGCIELASKLLQVQLPLNFECPWYTVFGVSSDELTRSFFPLFCFFYLIDEISCFSSLQEICNEILAVYD